MNDGNVQWPCEPVLLNTTTGERKVINYKLRPKETAAVSFMFVVPQSAG